MKLIIFFIILHFLSLGQSEKSETLNLGKYKYTCELSCYEIYTFLENNKYELKIWGDKTIYLGYYKLRKK
jgi:hypothetical protein